MLLTLMAIIFAHPMPMHAQGADDLEISGVKAYDIIANPFAGLYDEMKKVESVRHRVLMPSGEAVVLDLVHADILRGAAVLSRGSTPEGEAIPLRGWTDEGRDVRLTLAPDMAYGYIEMPEEVYWFEPAWYHTSHLSPDDDRIVIYKASDVDINVPNGCAVTDAHHKGHDLVRSSEIQTRTGQCFEVELAIASDFSMVSKYGSVAGVENRNIAVINNVNGDYSTAFSDEIVFVIVTQFVSNCASCDPWTASTNSMALLDDLVSWAGAGGFGVTHDVGELWTDRDLDGTTIGLAYVGTVCSQFRYHIVQDFSMNAQAIRVLTSHEIGHNFNAEHVGGNVIMAPTVSTTSNWANATINRINNYLGLVTGTNGCLSHCQGVGTPPTAAFQLSHDLVCPGSTVAFNDLSTDDPTSWTWSFPGGIPASASDPHPVIEYRFPGTYDVSLQVSNGGGSDIASMTSAITVEAFSGEEMMAYQDFDLGLGDWNIDNPDNGRTWQSVFVTDAPSDDEVMRMNNVGYAAGQRDGLISPELNLIGRSSVRVLVDYAYARRPGSPSDSLVVSVSRDGGANYVIVGGIADNGAGSMATAPPETGFVPDERSDWCSSSSLVSNCFDIDITSVANSRQVRVKVENVSRGGNLIYVDRIAILAACFSLDPPTADIASSNPEGCPSHTVAFEDISSNAPLTWVWSFPGGNPSTSTAPSPVVTYDQPGRYDVTLRVTNEVGQDEFTWVDYVVIEDQPMASFVETRENGGIQFTNTSSSANDFLWDFGDNVTSDEASPFHVYTADGTYEVTLTASNDCGSSSFSDTVLITSPVLVSLLPLNATLCSGQEVTYSSQASPNVTALEWRFEGGLPATSSLERPVVRYDVPGVYDVTLIASSPTSSDTVVVTNLVTVGAVPVPEVDIRRIDFLTYNIVYQGDSYDQILWSNIDGAPTTGVDSVTVSVTDYRMLNDSSVVSVTATNSCGDSTLTVSIAATPPYRTYLDEVYEICAGDPLSIQLDGREGINFDWTLAGADMPNQSGDSAVLRYSTGGDYVGMIMMTEGGATQIDSFFIAVTDLPQADFDADEATLTNQSIHADQYAWVVDGVVFSTEPNITLPQVSGDYDVLLIAANECGVDSARQTVSLVTSTRDVARDELLIWPNPTTGTVIITHPSSTLSHMTIYAMDGRLMEQAELPADVTRSTWHLPLSPGVYVVVLSGDQGQLYTARLVVAE